MAASPRGLPGFLRRSVRADYSEDDEDDLHEDQSISSNNSASSAPEGTATEQSNDENAEDSKQPQSSPAILENDESFKSSASSRASMPPMQLSAPQPAPLNRQASEPRIMHASQTQQPTLGDMDRSMPSMPEKDEPEGEKEKRPKTYKETQFEKIFAANVVSMNDLKTLAWNGIPVSSLTQQVHPKELKR